MRFNDSLSHTRAALRQAMGLGYREVFARLRTAIRLGLGILFKEVLNIPNVVRGEVFLEMRDASSGALLHKEHRQEARS